MTERTDKQIVKKFREVLHHHISTLEACDLQRKLFTNTETDKESSSIITPSEKTFTYDKGPRSFTGETLLSYEDVKSRYEGNCIFCSNNYWSDECHQYRDIKSRKKKLKDRCLKKTSALESNDDTESGMIATGKKGDNANCFDDNKR